MDFASELKTLAATLENYPEDSEPLEALQRVTSLTASLREPSEDPDRELLLAELPSLVSAILSNRKFRQPEAVEHANEALANVLLSLPECYTDPKYQAALRFLAELDRPFYTLYRQDEFAGAVPPEDLPDPLAEWRSTLSIGDQVDAIKLDKEYGRKCWARATIVYIDVDSRMHLSFEEEGQEWDRVILRSSPELAPLNTKSADDGWRSQLKEGSLIDVLDTTSVWYNATVLSSRVLPNTNGSSTTEVYVGYRVYEPTGEKYDERGAYRGWSVKYDEWISARSPRIAAHNTIARRWPVPIPVTSEEGVIDDSNDFVLPEYHCVVRAKECKSTLLIRNLNRFGQAGLFDFSLKLLGDRTNWLSFETFFSLAFFLGKLYAVYHKTFANKFVDQFRDAVCGYFLETPHHILRDFQRERIDKLKLLLGKLLKRVYTIEEKDSQLESFSVKMGLMFLTTPFLERRIHGLLNVSDVIKRRLLLPAPRLQQQIELLDSLEKINIIEEIFGAKSHFQLVQRSTDIVRLMASENRLTEAHLRVIWDCFLTDDEDTKKAVHKVLIDVSAFLWSQHLEFLVQSIAAITPSKLRTVEVELMYELAKSPVRNDTGIAQPTEFLFTVATNAEEYTTTVAELALEHFINLIKHWDSRHNRHRVMTDCAELIRQNKAASQCLQIIRKLLLTFPVFPSPSELKSRADVIEDLNDTSRLLYAFFENLTHFKALAQKRTEGRTEDLRDFVVCDNVGYKDQIEERLKFLLTVLTGNDSLTLSHEQMDALWELLMQQSLCHAEKEAFLKWLAEVTEHQSQGKKIFDDTSINAFFSDKVANLQNDYTDFSFEGFTLFKSYFLLVNVALSKMKQVNKYPTTALSDRIAKEFDYQLLVAPLQLEGMQCLRKIIMEAAPASTLDAACGFILELYDNVAEDLGEVREEFIQFALGYLTGGTMLQKRRGLRLLKSLLEQCDKIGTGGLHSHSALLKGELHTITISNQITHYPHNPDIPKRFELKLYSNTTLWELRKVIGQQVRALNDQFNIRRVTVHYDMPEIDNGKTLSELRFRSHETLTVTKRNSTVTKTSLLTADGDLSPKLLQIVTKWFHTYADKEGKMSAEGCAAFTNSCTGDPCKATDKRINDFFAKHDEDNDGLLTIDNFVEFYRDAVLRKPQTVWFNLYSHHYRNDLRRYDEGEVEPLLETLPRYLLTQKQENFDLIFSALNEEALANDAWELIVKLPTNPQVLQQVNELDTSILTTASPYKLLYVLQIFESYMEDSTDPQEQEAKSAWKIKFLEAGGFKHLHKFLLSFEYANSAFQKTCIAFLLKLLCMFILAAFSALSPDIYEVVELVRKNSEGPDEEPFELLEPEEPKTNDGKPAKTSKKVTFQDNVAEPNGQPESAEDTLTKYQNTQGFKQLVQDVMLLNLTDKITEEVDFNFLVSKLVNLMVVVLNKESYESEDKQILDSALELFVSCLLHKGELVNTVFGFAEQTKEFSIRGLTSPKSLLVRRAFYESLKLICTKVKEGDTSPATYYLALLIENLPTEVIDLNVADYTQYFELLCDLIELDMVAPSIDYASFMQTILQKLQTHPYTEKRNTVYADKVLVGLLKVAERIFRFNPEFKVGAQQLVVDIFVDMLFPPAPDIAQFHYDPNYAYEASHFQPPKAKARDSRSAACKLLATLVAGNHENLLALLPLLEGLKQQTSVVKSWNYSPASDMRGFHGYAGLVNLGCVCYMLSMLQQFYLIPQFRYSILAVDDGVPPTNLAYLQGDPSIDRTETGVDIDDNMLHQLQYLFSFLELTDRQAYNPSHFCYSFKDFTGAPTNISIQQDAQEFLNMIFDRLEQALKPTPYKYLTQGIFGGKTSNQIICKECQTVRESSEDFYSLSVDVKHSKSLHESLGKFITGDTISDFRCEKCNKLVEITKRTVLDRLPNILIVHLQRIVFSFDTFTNEKINSYLEFPHDLNLFPYTKQGIEHNPEQSDLPDQDLFKYELVGIVVHTGTADIGHYYSYIRPRLPDGSCDPVKWLEFNDKWVRAFK